jgi:hypothetical protein
VAKKRVFVLLIRFEALYTNLISVFVGRQTAGKNDLFSEIASGFVELNLIQPTLEIPK